MSADTNFLDKTLKNGSRGASWATAQTNKVLGHFKLPSAGNNFYLQTQGVSRAADAVQGMNTGMLGKAQAGGMAALDYFSGMDTGRVNQRLQGRIGRDAAIRGIGEGVTGAERAAQMGVIDENFGRYMNSRSGLAGVGKQTATAGQRAMRVGARGGLLGVGIAAADFLNPFGFGWND